MSLLFPLFIAAAGAVLAPILLHLLRNRARTVQVFSTVMFLTPSLPRVQPKMRVENLPLLLLRCLALILLAIAFARPWWSTAELTSTGQEGRTLVLLDTSVSMSRTGLWQQALEHLHQAVADPKQRIAVMAFDRALNHLVGFEDWAAQPKETRVDYARERASTIAPGSLGSDLGVALAGAVELMSEDEAAVRQVSGSKRIVLISDLQAGRGLDALQTASWPAGLQLVIRQVSSAQPSNAGLSLVGSTNGPVQDDEDERPRVRVSNDRASTAQQFTVTWSDNIGSPLNVTVPPGSSRVVRAPTRPPGKPGFSLVLRGDDHEFDNTVYVSHSSAAVVPVLYLGSDAIDDLNGLPYFLSNALSPTRVLAPRLVVQAATMPITGLDRFAWVVVGGAPSEAVAQQLRDFSERGGAFTVVLRQASDAGWLEKICGYSLSAHEASVKDHALIERVDFSHPLLRPFDAVQFGDFTKIRVWRYRSLTPPPTAQVLAWYENGQPAWFELLLGKGRVLVMTSGWNPADSQLALSTKFVPLIYTELQRSSRIIPNPEQIIIGDQNTMPTGVQAISGPLDPTTIDVAPMAGAPLGVTPTTANNPPADHAGSPPAAAQLVRPGLYSLQVAGAALLVAANIDPLESATAPLARETLEAIGVQVARTPVASAAELAAAEQVAKYQLKIAEIEKIQKSWMWILVATFVVLLIETIVASLCTTDSSAVPGASGTTRTMHVPKTGVAS